MSKEIERKELFKIIWKIANELRGSVDGWDFKQYVLGLLFYRFISENLVEYINNQEKKAGNVNFNYEKISDEQAEYGREETIQEKGFYILPSQLFNNIVKNAKNDNDINITLSNIFKSIENSAIGYDSEESMKGLFADVDFNSNKLGSSVNERNKKIIKLLNAIDSLKLGNYKENNIDVFGDAYEFLMTMYASEAGKSGGEFFTPQEVSELLTRLTIVDRKYVNKVYDPACGSGSLLLNFAKILGKENIKKGFYGQEKNITTFNLCKINMFLHDVNYDKFSIKLGDTLEDPKHIDDKPFDAIVSNPPYSVKWAGDNNPLLINDSRFSPAGVLAPKSKADLAFVMHMLSWLSPQGTCAIVEFPGVLYREGAEQKIRKYLIDNNFIDTVILLPSDLFFGVTIATCIIVLKKNKQNNNDILFIDASNEFVRKETKNKLSKENIKRIINAFKTRKNEENFAYLATLDEIKENDYDIEVNTYIKKTEKKENINIKELNFKIKQIVEKQTKIRNQITKILQIIK